MRLGIFGGSFDPPHNGHLLVAQDATDQLALDRLIVVPAAVQPLKSGHRTEPGHRLAMVRACFEMLPNTIVASVEIDRGGLSFMVDTVDHFRGCWPTAVMHLIVGEDVVPSLHRWRDPVRLLSMVDLVVLTRPDATVAPPSAVDDPSVDGAVHEVVAGMIRSAQRLATRRVDVSSTEIRARVRDGRSIRGFVPDAVAQYITSTALYKGGPMAEGSERA